MKEQNGHQGAAVSVLSKIISITWDQSYSLMSPAGSDDEDEVCLVLACYANTSYLTS